MFQVPGTYPIVVTYPVRIPVEARYLDVEFLPRLTDLVERVADGLLGLYRQVSEDMDIRDTGDFINTMAVHNGDDPLTKIVKSDVRYSGVIEDGWIWRPHGQASYPGRWPAAKTVERASEAIEPALDAVFGH